MPGLQRSYVAYNAATAALTAHTAFVPTGTSIKTMLQIKPTTNIIPIWWGYDIDSTVTAPVYVELITTGTVAATGLTAFNAGDVVKYGDSACAASAITLGTSASGFTATGEGTITATRLLSPGDTMAASYETQLPLDHECSVASTDYLRIRAHTATAVNMLCWVAWLEQ